MDLVHAGRPTLCPSPSLGEGSYRGGQRPQPLESHLKDNALLWPHLRPEGLLA